MPTITFTLPVAGTDADAGPIATNFADLQTLLNGGLDADNIDASGTPNSSTFLRGDMVWATANPLTYRSNSLVTVVNTTTTTDLVSQSVAALSATNVLRLRAWGDILNNAGADRGFRLEILFGGTTIYDITANTLLSATNVRFPWFLDFVIENLGATNSQNANGAMVWDQAGVGAGSPVSPPTTGIGRAVGGTGIRIGSNGTVAVDTSGSQTLVVRVTLSNASATYDLRRYGWVLEVL